jgi:hypothetical protein
MKSSPFMKLKEFCLRHRNETWKLPVLCEHALGGSTDELQLKFNRYYVFKLRTFFLDRGQLLIREDGTLKIAQPTDRELVWREANKRIERIHRALLRSHSLLDVVAAQHLLPKPEVAHLRSVLQVRRS